MSIQIKFRCRRINVPDLIGATVHKESLLFNLLRLSAEKKYPALVHDEKDEVFKFRRLELPDGIDRVDYLGMFVGFQTRALYYACFMPVRQVVEQLIEAEEELELKDITLKMDGRWTVVWSKGNYTSTVVFDFEDGDTDFVLLKGDRPKTEEDEEEE